MSDATAPRATIVPLSLAEANEIVARWHRHSNPTVGHKFSLVRGRRQSGGAR